MSPFPKVEPRKERDEHYKNGDRSETHLASSRGELDRMTSTITPQRPGNTNLTRGPRNPAQTRDTSSRLGNGRKSFFARQRPPHPRAHPSSKRGIRPSAAIRVSSRVYA